MTLSPAIRNVTKSPGILGAAIAVFAMLLSLASSYGRDTAITSQHEARIEKLENDSVRRQDLAPIEKRIDEIRQDVQEINHKLDRSLERSHH